MKFGADFLMYEGDPLTCHAKYLVKVLMTSKIKAEDLILYERVANSAKKDLLLMFKEGQANRFEYCAISY